MSVTRAAIVLALGCTVIGSGVIGCNTPVPPIGGFDTWAPDTSRDGGTTDVGSHDTGVRRDGDVGSLDGGTMDGGTIDGGTLDGGTIDGGTIDGGPVDAMDSGGTMDAAGPDAPDLGPMPDSSGCRLADGAYDLCACGTLSQDCSASACPSGQTCTPDICGMHCVEGGSACAGPADCPPGTACTSGFCAHSATCTDSRNCALGYACEGGACVDRRFPCSVDSNCPYGYACDTSLGLGTCIRLSRPCATAAACNGTFNAAQVCVDIDGDGTTECQFANGPCMTNADCFALGVVCTPHALTDLSVCGVYGPCRRVGDCPAGAECRDLWGDGIRECVVAGGCTNSAACPLHQVCATPPSGGPPSCRSSGA